MSKIVVLGASPNRERFSYKAVKALRRRNYDIVALGAKEGEIGDIHIQTGQPELEDVDTILLYLNPENQKPVYDYVLSMKPRRIIFNPGTNNKEFSELADRNGIEVVHNCALVMLTSEIF